MYIKYTENYREGQPQKNFNQFRLFDLRDIFIDNDDNWTEEMTVAVIGKVFYHGTELTEQGLAQNRKVQLQGK